MTLLKWSSSDSIKIFGTIEERISSNIIAIAHTQDASEYIGILFEDDQIPESCSIIDTFEQDKYYFIYQPSQGYWLTDNLISFVIKDCRQKELDSLIIEYNGNTYDANEVSQERLSRAILTIGVTSIEWKDSNNNFQTLEKNDLQEILNQAMISQSNLWKKYYR